MSIVYELRLKGNKNVYIIMCRLSDLLHQDIPSLIMHISFRLGPCRPSDLPKVNQLDAFPWIPFSKISSKCQSLLRYPAMRQFNDQTEKLITQQFSQNVVHTAAVCFDSD